MAKYKVTIGSEFQIEAMGVPSKGTIDAASQAATQMAETKTRGVLAYLIVGAISFALVLAALLDYTVHQGVWQATTGVWAAAAFPLGFVLGHYFTKK